MTISEIVQCRDTRSGRIFDATVIVLILVSVITVTINTLPDLSPSVQTVISWSEVVIVGLFTVEYGLRIGTAPRKLRYAFSFHGIVDLAAILPFLLTLGGGGPPCAAGTGSCSASCGSSSWGATAKR